MARGWGSKSVEEQISVADSINSDRSERTESTQKELQIQRKKAELLLSRKMVLDQLERSTSERYADMLRRSLADLDTQIANG